MVLKITDKVKFLLRILSCITVCTKSRRKAKSGCARSEM